MAPIWKQLSHLGTTQQASNGKGDINAEFEGISSGHIEIDPYGDGRSPYSNYKLLISAVVPRPIGFLSTQSRDGLTTNLAPFSYFQMFNHDPPMFMFGFATSLTDPRDSLRNLVETREGVVNIASEQIVTKMNAASVDAPYGTSEFALTGLEPAPSSVVKAPRVKEAIFAVECKLVEVKEYHSKINPGQVTATMAILEGVRFWAKEHAINSDRSHIDIEVLRPLSRLGGTTFGLIGATLDIPRPRWGGSSATGVGNAGPQG